MAQCELIDTCPFFNDKLANKPDEVEDMKETYCKNNNLNCARYMVFNSVGKDNMPENLYPDEKTRAYMFIAENS